MLAAAKSAVMDRYVPELWSPDLLPQNDPTAGGEKPAPKDPDA